MPIATYLLELRNLNLSMLQLFQDPIEFGNFILLKKPADRSEAGGAGSNTPDKSPEVPATSAPLASDESLKKPLEAPLFVTIA